jgi:type VI secretion system protein ImpF
VSPTSPPRPKPSLLDRLLDDAPRNPHDVPTNANQALTAVREAVRRDLENLLNTRSRPVSREFESLQDSLVHYGIPDWFAYEGPAGRDAIGELIRLAIQRCEPRLRDIKVEALADRAGAEEPLRFRIVATLHIEPWSAPIVFDSFLDSTNGSLDVTRGRL